MNDLMRDVEQFELACGLARENTPTSARLALFLLDNIIEGIAFRRADDYFFRKIRETTPGKEQYLKEYFKIRSHFSEKIDFVKKTLKLIDEDEAVFFKQAHAVRNDSYHHSRFHEPIIIPVVRAFLKYLCSAYPKCLGSQICSVGSEREKAFSERFKTTPFEITQPDRLGTVLREMANGLTGEANELAVQLSNYLATKASDLIATLESFCDERRRFTLPGRVPFPDPREFLKMVQFQSSYEFQVAFGDSDEEFRRTLKKQQDDYDAYQPKITMAVLASWLKLAQAIARCQSPGDALSRFSTIDKAFCEIDDLVGFRIYETEEYEELE